MSPAPQRARLHPPCPFRDGPYLGVLYLSPLRDGTTARKTILDGGLTAPWKPHHTAPVGDSWDTSVSHTHSACGRRT